MSDKLNQAFEPFLGDPVPYKRLMSQGEVFRKNEKMEYWNGYYFV